MKKISLAIFATALVSLTSCLKDGRVNLGPGAPVSPPVVEWATNTLDDAPLNSNAASYRAYNRSLPTGGTAVNLTLQVDVTGSDPAPQDITVGLGTNNAAYLTFVGGTASATTPQLPAAAYTIPATVTIAKGTRSALVNIVINMSLLPDLTKTYYIPVQVTSTNYGNVSGNYGTVIYELIPGNKYDGVYSYANATTATYGAGKTATGAQLVTSLSAPTTDVQTTFLQTPAFASTITYTFSNTLNASGYYPLTKVSMPDFFPTSSIDPVSGYYPATKVIRSKFTAGGYNIDETYTYTGARTSAASTQK